VNGPTTGFGVLEPLKENIAMSILESSVPSLPSKLWSTPYSALVRVGSFLAVVVDTFAEAQKQAHEAERRYPFLNW
jgi:hypothetical protein